MRIKNTKNGIFFVIYTIFILQLKTYAIIQLKTVHEEDNDMKYVKKFIKNHATQITSLAMAMAVIVTNMTCWGRAYQEELPEEVDRLRKFK